MRRPVAWSALTAPIIFLICAAPTAAATGGPLDHVPEIRPAWKAAFDGVVRWQRVTSGGRLVVATSKGVHGVDPETGRTAWSHRHLVDLPEAAYEEIAGTSLVVLGDGKRKGHIAVVDAADGRMVFDSRAARFGGILGHSLLPRCNGLFVVGLKDGGRATVIAMIDVPGGRMRWENAAALSGGGAFLATMGRVTHAIANVTVVQEAPIEIDAESFLLNTPTGLLRVSSGTGEVRWTNRDFRDMNGVRMFVDPKDADRFYVAGEARAAASGLRIIPGAETASAALYAACSLADGRSLWRQPANVHGKADNVILTGRGLVVSPRGSKDGTLNLLDRDSGKPRWGKDDRGIGVPGGIVDHLHSDEGWVVTTGREGTAKDGAPECFLNLLDDGDGSLRFERPVRVRGRLLQADASSRALLYVTTAEAGLLHPRTGLPVAAPVLSRTGLITARHEDSLYAYAVDAGSLYLVDLKRATTRGISDRPVRLKDRDVPVMLHATEDAVTLVGRSNMVGFDATGTVKFHVHYPAPGDLRVTAPLRRAQESRAVPAHDYALMAVDLGKNVYGIAKVARSSGAIQGVVRMRGSEVPAYDLDPAAGRLYYRQSPTEIAAYRF